MADEANLIERLRERYRPRFPHHKLILCIDRRAAAVSPFVITVDRDSAWFELLPDEQIIELHDNNKAGGRQVDQLLREHERPGA